MRERSQTTPRRRRNGPKQPLPTTTSTSRRNSKYLSPERCEGAGIIESPYYTLLPAERSYMDPWDLENYDYVRKKLDDVPMPIADYEPAIQSSLTPSPTAQPDYGQYDPYNHHYGDDQYGNYYNPNGYGMAATMPRPHTRRISRSRCQLECCAPVRPSRDFGRYDDYMSTMIRDLHLDSNQNYNNNDDNDDEPPQLYSGYGELSSGSASSMEPPSRRAVTLQRRSVPNRNNNNVGINYGYGTAPNPRSRKPKLSAPPQMDFPAPLAPLPPQQQQQPLQSMSMSMSAAAYDYCNPYSTLAFCSAPDCTECQQQATSLIYAAPSTLYGRVGVSGVGASGGDHSLYAGVYASKFGLSKKGLLQIDYSCSWNDLDRVIGRQY